MTLREWTPDGGIKETYIALDHDTALFGASMSLELSPDAKVFADYDGDLSHPGAPDLLRVRF